MILKTLAKTATLIPKSMRRALADTRFFHAILHRTVGNRFRFLTTAEGQQMAIHPIYHGQLLTLKSLVDYEPLEREVIGRLCRPGMTAYDVGANVGMFTCYMSHLVGKAGHVIAFEPESNNFNCLEVTIRHNGLSNVQLEKKAVGKATELAQFDRRGGAFSGRLATPGKCRMTANQSTVEVVSLDDLVKLGTPPPDLVKIDVEGNEVMVLEGMQSILQTHRPTVLCEIHTHLGDPSQAVIEILSRFDYEMFGLEGIAAGTPTSIKDLQVRDWFVACPRAKREQLLAA